MNNEIIPIVQTVAEFIPPRKNGFFEKSMEVAHLILDHEPLSAICNTVNNAIQTYGMISETKYRVKALKYTTHLEEVRINAAVEMARIQTASNAMNLYIDRSFQRSLDNMEASFMEQSYKIESSRRKMIQEVNKSVENHLINIDKRYIDTVRENEMKCAMYRDFVNQSNKEGITQTDVTLFITKKLAENMHRYNNKAVISICDVISEMMRNNHRISFDEYLKFEKRLKKFR